ncbi:hypothetical protein PVK64_20245 [Aliivibrio sp. S4TY2]|nr:MULTISPECIES: hypothetical protein [Aliivibrio]MDD9158495.1 hypothetical protein [Aliivibrio sp. S4TY2]MDD9162492.1 hypothetical protein [Aliivibrio sp. S4TY1]MDD9166491.1 hypothetical protein [Aliivibrio sp. S4MY2]MDD9170489.1 hypothetical protein [Aliivibrio sp. S4MY4]MDD9187570.1 hypothetical protein [Aliivibrio sp. S4MY3]
MSSTKMRFLGVVFFILIPLLWWVPTNGVWRDYQNLLNHKDEVQLSLFTLWVPIGGFFAVILNSILMSITIISGKKARLIIGEHWTSSINKTCIYSALFGVIFAMMFALYSMKLLDEYGYEYSYELTKITPTGIHLMYVKAP